METESAKVPDIDSEEVENVDIDKFRWERDVSKLEALVQKLKLTVGHEETVGSAQLGQAVVVTEDIRDIAHALRAQLEEARSRAEKRKISQTEIIPEDLLNFLVEKDTSQQQDAPEYLDLQQAISADAQYQSQYQQLPTQYQIADFNPNSLGTSQPATSSTNPPAELLKHDLCDGSMPQCSRSLAASSTPFEVSADAQQQLVDLQQTPEDVKPTPLDFYYFARVAGDEFANKILKAGGAHGTRDRTYVVLPMRALKDFETNERRIEEAAESFTGNKGIQLAEFDEPYLVPFPRVGQGRRENGSPPQRRWARGKFIDFQACGSQNNNRLPKMARFFLCDHQEYKLVDPQSVIPIRGSLEHVLTIPILTLRIRLNQPSTKKLQKGNSISVRLVRQPEQHDITLWLAEDCK